MRALLAALCVMALSPALAFGDVPAPASTDAGVSTTKDDSGCTQGPGGPASALLLAGACSLLFFAFRKREE